MAGGVEGVTVERVWDSSAPFTVYRLPSSYGNNRLLMVYEDLNNVWVDVVTPEEYKQRVQELLTNG